MPLKSKILNSRAFQGLQGVANPDLGHIHVYLMFKQLLPSGSIQNVWREIRRICVLILGFEGLTQGVCGRRP